MHRHDLVFTRRQVAGGLAAGLALAAVPGWAAALDPGTAVGRVRKLDSRLDDLLGEESPVERLTAGLDWAEGPVWVPQLRTLLFSDVPQNKVYRWAEGHGEGLFLSPAGIQGPAGPEVREGGANGLAVDADGRLLVADSGTRALVRVDLVTKARTVLAASWQGKRFNSPNDLTVARDGAVYFTDPPYGLKDGDKSPAKELPHNGVYRYGADGTLTLLEAALSLPNGIGLSPAEDRLYVSVSDPAAPRIMVYDLDRAGQVSNGRVFFDARPLMGPDVPGLPDGLSVDRRGNLFASGPGGLMVLTPEAKLLGVIEVTGRPVSNCCFAGKWLYMTADDSVVRIKTRTRG